MATDQQTIDYLNQLSAEHTLQEQLAADSAHFRSARITKQDADFQPPHRAGDSAIRENWDMMTRRIRDLSINDPLVKRATRAIRTLVVGSGINAFADAVPFEALISPNPSLDDLLALEPFNAESDLRFDDWSEHGADVHGNKSWLDLQNQTFEEMTKTGNGFLVRCAMRRPNQDALLCYDAFEYEQLDRSQDRPRRGAENEIVNGIEYDAAGNVVAYHVHEVHPFNYFWGAGYGTKSTRIPAARVIHCFIAFRPSARSGMSWHNALMVPARDLDNYLGNELTAAALGALLVAAVKRKGAAGGGGRLGLKPGDTMHGKEGVSENRWGRGIFLDLFTDEEVQILESKRPPGSAVPWLDLMLHQLAAASDVSYYRMTGNYQKTSYSSTKAAHLDDEIFNAPLQMMFARTVVTPTRTTHDRQIAARGLFRTVNAATYFANERDYQRFYKVGAGTPLIDPNKDVAGAAGLIRMGISTLKEQAGKRNKNWRRCIDQRAIEQEYARRRGVVLDFTAQQGGGPELPEPPEPTRGESDDDDQNAAGSWPEAVHQRMNGHALLNG